MGDPLFDKILGIGGGGLQQVVVDPERVTKEEYETAQTMTNIIWGTEGLVACLGPAWSLVHDPRFLRIERGWVKDEEGMFGGKKAGGITVLTALDLRSKISLVEDPVLYSEMLAEGRHFRDVCLKQGLDPKTLHKDPVLITSCIASECPNYFRRNGSMNPEGEKLEKLLQQDIVGLVDDYAELAYSRDWIRMDTEEVCRKDEIFWDEASGMMVPVIAVEVDSIHKAIVMRAMVRTTALRMMQQFPGIKKEDFESITLTDNESDLLCQLIFKADYDKMYTIMPEVMMLIQRAQRIPYEDRLDTELNTMAVDAKVFHTKLKSGEIEPILTPIEESEVVNPKVFLEQVAGNTYLREVFQLVQDRAERGDEKCEELLKVVIDSGGNYAAWGAIDDFLLAEGTHPHQHIYEGHLKLTPGEEAEVRATLKAADIVIEHDHDDDVIMHLEDGPLLDRAVQTFTFIGTPDYLEDIAVVVYRNDEAPVQALVEIACKRHDIRMKEAPKVTVVEGAN